MVPNGSAYADYPVFAGSGTKVKPSPDAKYAQGFLPGETLPAEWANYLFYGATGGVTRLNADTDSIKKELNSILTAFGITNNADAYNQVLTALNRIYPQICECTTAASTEVKSVAITGDGVILKAGNVYAITMTNGNTYGNGTTTYPKLSINSGTAYPICDSCGRYAKSGAWKAGDTVKVLFTGTKYIMAAGVADRVESGNQQAVTSNSMSCRMTANKSVTGPELGTGGIVRVMFTADITGTDTTTGLTLTYNGTGIAVKVNKNGILADFVAVEASTSTYKYLQAYTVLELIYDGTNFIIKGNPLVISDANNEIYADGYNDHAVDVVEENNASAVQSRAVASALSYSTTEQKTGGYWIDGKPIYRRILKCTTQTNLGNSWTDIAGWSVENTDIDKYITVRRIGDYAERTDHRESTNKKLQFNCTTSVFTVLVNDPLLIEYTKTTD